MNGINLSITQGGLTQQHRPKQPQTQTNLSPGQFADTHQQAPPIHPPRVEVMSDISPDKTTVSGNSWWDFATQALDSVSTLFSPAVEEAVRPTSGHSGGMSAIGRLGMLIAFFGSAATAGAQHLRGNEVPVAFPEWQTHNYLTETKHLEGTSEWFRIAHIADGNSTSARFNLNGHHGHNHWDVNIQLWAGINAVSSCWNTANEAHVVQGFRFATGPENHLFLEIQGTPQPDTTLLGASATGMGFNPIQFAHATDSIVLRHYDFASIGSLKNGCLSDQISGGAGHVTMVDGHPVITVKETGLGVFQSDPEYPLDVAGTARATAFMGDGQALTYLNATELRYGQVPSDRISGSYTGITEVGELGELVVGGNLGIGTPTPGVSLEVAGIGRFTSSSGFSIGSDPGHNRLEYSTSGFSRISALSSGNAYLGLSAKSLSIGTTYGSISPPGNGAIFEGNVGIGTSSPDALLSVNGVASFGAGTATLPSITKVGDLDTGIWFPGGDTMAVSTGGSERMRITSLGQVLINAPTSRIFLGGATIPWLQIESVSSAQSRSQSIVNNHNSAAGPIFFMGKSRGTATGSNTVVTSGDNTGEIYFMGADGSDLIRTASIASAVDAPPGTNDMPGRLVFSTTADGAASPTERMRIDSAGNVGIGISNPVAPLQVKEHYYDYSIPAISGGSSNQDQIVLFAKVGTAVVFKGTIDTTSTATSNTLLRNFNRIALIYRTSTTNTTQPQVSVVSHHNGHNAHGSDNCKVVKVTLAGEDYWGLILQDLSSYQDPGAPVFTGRASSLSDFQFGYRGVFTAVEDQTITPSLSAMRIPYSSLSAWSFSGDGAGLTNLNANALSTGNIPSLRLLGSYPNITTVGSLTSLRVTGAARFDSTVSIPNLATGTGTALVVDSNGDVFKSSSSTLSVSDGSASTPAITGTTANTGIWFPSAGHMAFSSSGQERARFGGLGNLLIGHTSDINYSSGDQSKLQITGVNGGDGSGLFSIFSTTSTTLPGIYLAHANSNTKGTYTLVTSGFKLGILGFAGADGTQFVRAAAIFAEVDGNPGANDMPGRLVFCTTADGAATCTEAMRIDNAGNMGIGNQSPTSRVSVRGTQTSTFTTKLSTANMNGVSTISLENLNGIDSMYAAYQFYVHNGAGSDQYASLVAESTTSGYAPKIHFLQRTAASAQSIRMTIDESGKVGVGTTTPDALLTVNGVSSFGAGTAALPSMTKVGDLDTGIWFPAADTVAVSTGGNERVRVDSSARVLIGNTEARAIEVAGATNAGTTLGIQIESLNTGAYAGLSTIFHSTTAALGPTIYLARTRGNAIGASTIVQSGDNLGGIRWAGGDGTDIRTPAAEITASVDGTPGVDDMPGRLVFSTTSDGAATPTERMRINSAGNVGIGTTGTVTILNSIGDSIEAKLVANKQSGTAAIAASVMDGTRNRRIGLFTDDTNNIVGISYTYSSSSPSFIIRDGSSTRILITESGYIGFGTNTPGAALHIGGTGTLRIPGAIGGTGTPAIIDANGDLRPDTSSERFKEDITDLEFDPSLLMCMRAVQYVIKNTGEKDFGLVAEELFKIFPLAVNLDTDGLPYSIKYHKLVAPLLKGWQAHEKSISEMKASLKFFQEENQVLKKKSEEQDQRLSKLEALLTA